MKWGKLCEICYCDIAFLVSDNTDIFLNQLIQLYLNNATNLHYLTSWSTLYCPQHTDCIVTTDYCDIISLLVSSTKKCCTSCIYFLFIYYAKWQHI